MVSTLSSRDGCFGCTRTTYQNAWTISNAFVCFLSVESAEGMFQAGTISAGIVMNNMSIRVAAQGVAREMMRCVFIWYPFAVLLCSRGFILCFCSRAQLHQVPLLPAQASEHQPQAGPIPSPCPSYDHVPCHPRNGPSQDCPW